MASSKLVFVGSKISPSADEIGVINLNVLFSLDSQINIMVSIPNNTWADTNVLFDNMYIDLTGEYPAIINTAIRKANKLFPEWTK